MSFDIHNVLVKRRKNVQHFYVRWSQRSWWNALERFVMCVHHAADSLVTCNLFLCCSASHRSYCVCWLSQLSEEVSNAIESRTAISGLIPARPFKRADRVFRLTPRAIAAAVTEMPSGSRHSSLIISPGWGGLYISIIFSQW